MVTNRVDVRFDGPARTDAASLPEASTDAAGLPPGVRATVLETFAFASSDGGEYAEVPVRLTITVHDADAARLVVLVREPGAARAVRFSAGTDDTASAALTAERFPIDGFVLEFESVSDAENCVTWFSLTPEGEHLPPPGDETGFGDAGDEKTLDEPLGEAFPRIDDVAVPRADVGPILATPSPRRLDDSLGSAPVDAHVLAEMPASSRVDDVVTVTVSLSRTELEATCDAASGTARPSVIPDDDVIVTLSPRGYRLAPEQPAEQRLHLPRGERDVDSCTFDLVAVDVGRAEVTVVLRQSTPLPIATILVSTDIRPAETRLRGRIARSRAVATEPDPAIVALPTISVDESLAEGVSTLTFSLVIGDESASCVKVIPDKRMYIRRVLEGLATVRSRVAAAHRPADRRAAADSGLEDIGTRLFVSLFDEPARLLLWNNRASLDGLIIQTTGEFDIPWEIVHLVSPDGDIDPAHRFLGDHGLTRWVYGPALPQHFDVARTRTRHICPDYRAPAYRLPFVEAERQFVTRRLHSRAVDPDDAGGVTGLLSGPFDLLHFAGHGEWTTGDPPHPRLLLAGFDPTDAVEGAAYSADDLRRDLAARDADGARPIVFLNACDVGRLASSSAGAGGFPEVFLRGGIGALIGCSWAVDDQSAGIFVREFYTRLLGRPPSSVAHALAAARERARSRGDLNWLAYVAYADPRATVTFS
ncbi:DUF7363 domain-containing protein [Agromyces atrinae]|uniref:CHAT domain-containing protein n=1 Tax=Agromyces atrinae TaxID=592376 RepID=A0A4Q2M3K3_9MICO|nr:CHAT domain-containing protein [Agromyces atrinae]NYD65493.1 hypothetical protein [Agromyces atrinae]RXZ85777.1 CHAT domain-containing protein [Agromyces atrinae]